MALRVLAGTHACCDLEEIICSRLNCISPPNSYVEAPTFLVPWNLTLLGKRVIADINTKGTVTLPYDWCLYKRGRLGYRRTQREIAR